MFDTPSVRPFVASLGGNAPHTSGTHTHAQAREVGSPRRQWWQYNVQCPVSSQNTYACDTAYPGLTVRNAPLVNRSSGVQSIQIELPTTESSTQPSLRSLFCLPLCVVPSVLCHHTRPTTQRNATRQPLALARFTGALSSTSFTFTSTSLTSNLNLYLWAAGSTTMFNHHRRAV